MPTYSANGKINFILSVIMMIVNVLFILHMFYLSKTVKKVNSSANMFEANRTVSNFSDSGRGFF